MIDRVTVRRGAYHDSVTLMLASHEAGGRAGVADASIVSATPLNLELLERAGFALPPGEPLEPTDLVLAVRAESDEAAAAAVAAAEERLGGSAEEPLAAEAPPRSLLAAARRRADASLAVVSVPGTAAAYECAVAIEAGLHVFCFSSGFDAELEAALKRRAAARGLLLMGPDCGTAIVDGVGIGFANALGAGPVGLIGASGTGLQQVGCLLDFAGVGVSQVIGVGGRDLSASVGGTMCLQAIELLERDPDTEAIGVIAKSPDPGVAALVSERLAATGKPAVLWLGGVDDGSGRPPRATTLEHAAALLAEAAGAALTGELVAPPSCRPGAIRGLFSGGTLRDEALTVLRATSDKGLAKPPLSLDREPSAGDAGRHVLVDYGSEALTAGRAHPMIDPSLRTAAVAPASAEPGVSVLLLDVVLGRGAHPDPAATLAPAVERAVAARRGELAVVVSLCGAAGDAQGLERQAARLREAGATVTRSNAHAARLALAAATGAGT